MLCYVASVAQCQQNRDYLYYTTSCECRHSACNGQLRRNCPRPANGFWIFRWSKYHKHSASKSVQKVSFLKSCVWFLLEFYSHFDLEFCIFIYFKHLLHAQWVNLSLICGGNIIFSCSHDKFLYNSLDSISARSYNYSWIESGIIYFVVFFNLVEEELLLWQEWPWTRSAIPSCILASEIVSSVQRSAQGIFVFGQMHINWFVKC